MIAYELKPNRVWTGATKIVSAGVGLDSAWVRADAPPSINAWQYAVFSGDGWIVATEEPPIYQSQQQPSNDGGSSILADLASAGLGKGSDLVAHKPAANGAINRSLRTKLSDAVSVKDFGAIGDGVADDTAAFLAAVNHCVAAGYNKVRTLHIPSGNYVITANNAFGQWNSIDTAAYRGIIGFKVIGDGIRNTKITLKNSGNTDFYLWDNYSGSGTTAANNSMQFPAFEGLHFIASATGAGKINGFRGYGTSNGYPSQGFLFNRCMFENFNVFFNAAGLVNESENTFNSCHAFNCTTIFSCSNPQSVNHAFIACHFEGGRGDVFSFSRGGQIVVLGGSYIMAPDSDSYLIRLNPIGAGLGATFVFYGIRTEMHNSKCKIISFTGPDNDGVVKFDTCAFTTRLGGAVADSISIDGESKGAIVFDNCRGASGDGVIWNAGSNNYFLSDQPWTTLSFERCNDVTKSLITWSGNALGFTRIVGSRTAAHDWEGSRLGLVPGETASKQGVSSKAALGFIAEWPSSAGGGGSVVIPVGSVIKSINVRMTARGSNASDYQIEVVDGSGVQIPVPVWGYGAAQSTLAKVKSEHYIFMENLMKTVSDPASGTVTVRAKANNDGGIHVDYMLAGDFFIVEYY